jgi:hypothetical protein
LNSFERDEHHYTLDPKDIYGHAFPGETFRILKEKEEREFGEYRTRRLVLEACTANVGIPFRDNDHWQRVMGGYMQGILTRSFPET